MTVQKVFQRRELKYMLTRSQHQALLKVMEPYMHLDEFGHSTIRNIYYDTDSFRLIRRSIEKPAYKEKLRIRSYRKATGTSTVFVELKKKYDHIVYKRRMTLPENEALEWLAGGEKPEDSQIAREIEFFRDFYKELHPAMFLSYEREAYAPNPGSPMESGFRITFDENIRSRRDNISLDTEIWGDKVISDDSVLMEVKAFGGMPVWLTDFLTENHIFGTSFSKYGAAYTKFVLPEMTAGSRTLAYGRSGQAAAYRGYASASGLNRSKKVRTESYRYA
ncbi:MAG: polyphosphate polymerase domain-containing protein [Lachnospiraceae bacterium]|nr:polyphosphate polymerase domain-containing protein [Lachnospiraceae bacterium]